MIFFLELALLTLAVYWLNEQIWPRVLLAYEYAEEGSYVNRAVSDIIIAHAYGLFFLARLTKQELESDRTSN